MNAATNPFKRTIDIVGAGGFFVFVAPIMAVAALAIRMRLGMPVLFRHVRPGLHGRTFELLKFRTMTNATDGSGQLLRDDERLTGLGRFLRRTSLDELPELWNVLRGDMSLVGPRPLLVEYLDRYSPEQARRHDVKPGITGLAQINGRNELDWEERLALDVWYVDNWSLWLDVQILARTIGEVVGRKGINAPGHATMPEFRGTEGSSS